MGRRAIDLERKQIPMLKPGQLWQWDFSVQSSTAVPKGFWPASKVSEEGRRTGITATGTFILEYGMTFVIVRTDDEGPYQFPTTNVDENGLVSFNPPKRYHVVLIREALVWFEHSWFETCKLLADVE